jgi:hypothetical protein
MSSNSIFIPDPSISRDMLNTPAPPAANYNQGTDEPAEPEKKQKDDLELQAFLKEAKDRFKLAADAENEQRIEALEDLRFRVGDQWPFEVKSRRDQDGRPCLTINRIPQFLRQITNEQRQNRPAIQIDPVGDGADVKTAEVLEGLIRSIEQNDGDIAYDTAFDFAAATGGPGWLRVLTQYVDSISFDQEIVIGRVPNPMMVYADPNSKDPAGRDLNWVFIVEDLSEDEYRQQYPKSELAGLPDFSSVGDRGAGWITKKSIRIAEYYYRKPVQRTLCQLDDGVTGFEEDLNEEQRARVVGRREAQDYAVKWCKINAIEKLAERDDYKGKYIPMVPVLGDEVIVDGKRKLSGVIRFAKDAQRAYNYWTSAETEMIALAPKAPYILEAGQIEGYEDMWKNLNNKNFAYLPYKAKTVGDTMAPPPQRAQWEPPVQAISMARAQATDDLKATTGIYEASLGQQGNETSGRAILARQHEGSVSNFHLSDNLARSIRQVGRIILDLIPHVYDAPRVARIIGREEQQRIVNVQSSINPTVPPIEGEQPDDDINHIYDVGMGKYDVTVSVGPSFNTKRQEAVASMLQLTQSFPQIIGVAGDLMVKNMDWPGAQEIAKRLKTMLPPEIQAEEDSEKGEAPKIPPQMQAQIQQIMQQNEQLTQIVTDLNNDRDKRVLELASRERIAAMQTQATLITTEAKIQSQEAINNIRVMMDSINNRLDMLSKIEEDQGMTPEPGVPAGMGAEMAPGGPLGGGGQLQ